MRRTLLPSLALLLILAGFAQARTAEYHLVIDRQAVDITGKSIEKITVNGTIPGPTLRFSEGDEAIIHVTNRMDRPTSIHWHGLLLPDAMDGVPGFGGFPGIASGETFTYRFTIRQNGTYWYHAHSGAQEQDGLYGALIITPRDGEAVVAERDYVVLLSDYSEEDAERILANLKMDGEYYQNQRRTLFDFVADVRNRGLGPAWSTAKAWGLMRMAPTDLADVSGYTFLVNGQTPEVNWTGLFTPGERVRLRFINASAMTFYDVRIPGLKMTLLAADGQPVEPLEIDEFRFGIAETYDVLVTPPEAKAYTIAAESIERAGFALATLAPAPGLKGEIPKQRPRPLLTLADMGMGHAGHDMAPPMPAEPAGHHESMEHHGHGQAHGAMDHAPPQNATNDYATGVPGSGWAESGAPPGTRLLAYKDLRYQGIRKDAQPPEREIEIRLDGNMHRYVWTINGKKFSEAEPIRLAYGERVRLKFVNDTMMAHSMHLHGMFVQLENGQTAAKLPNKHTLIVAPGDTQAAWLTADEPGEWAFHCHMLYHMLAGMMTQVVVAKAAPGTGHTLHTMDHAGHADHGRTAHEIAAPKAATHVLKEHGGGIFHAFRLEAGLGQGDGENLAEWDFDGWIGGDEHKLWIKSEGERTAGETEQAEAWLLYSRKIATFWDLQIGARHDFQPTSTTYLVFGIDGLAPFFLETEAHLFLSDEGDLSARLRLEKDLLLSQRLITQPYLEGELYAQDVRDRSIGASLADLEIGLQTRYEFSKRFAPYLDLRYERKLGETAAIAKRQGEDRDAGVVLLGLKVLF